MKKGSFEMDELLEKLKKVIKKADVFINGVESQLVLEVGNNTTKMVEFSVKNNTIEVDKGFVINTPINTIKNDRLVNYNMLTNLLVQYMSQNNIKNKEFVVSIASKEIITREMTVPQMLPHELKSFVQLNSTDIFPVNLANYVLGYNIIEKGESNRILIAAIPKDIIIPYIELGEHLGLKLKGFNYSGYELYNFLNFELGKVSKPYLALYIGARNTNLVVIVNGVLKFNKIIPRGYEETSIWLTEDLNCNFVKAEQLKRQYNTLEIDESLDSNSEEYIVAKYTRRCFDNISRDVIRIIEFYNTNNAKNKIDKVYLVGMVGRIKGIEKYFTEKFNLSVVAIKNLSKINFNKKSLNLKSRQINFINCFGAHTLTDIEFNFIKGDLKIERIPFLLTKKFHKLAIAAVVLLVLPIIMNAYSFRLLSNKVLSYQEFIDSKSDIVEIQNRISDKQGDLNELNAKINSLEDRASKYLNRLAIIDKSIQDLNSQAPINIASYSMKSNSCILKCYVELNPDEYATRINMPNVFRSALEKNDFGEDVKIEVTSNSASELYVNFTISMKFE